MIDSEFERKGREMATTWDNLLETNDALMRRIAELERERDTIGAVLAEKSRNAVVSGGTPTLTERAANNRIAELEREREALRETIGQMEHEANTQHAAALDLQAQRDAAQQSSARLVGLVRFKNLEIKVLASDVKDLDTGNKELITELDAATKRAEQAEADACELANLVLMIGDVTDAGDLELVNKYTGRN